MQADTQETLVYGVLGAIHLGTSSVLVYTLQHKLQHALQRMLGAVHPGTSAVLIYSCMYIYTQIIRKQFARAPRAVKSHRGGQTQQSDVLQSV